MIKFFSILLTVLLLIGCETTSVSKQTITSVPPTEFKTLAESGDYTVIDVRTATETQAQNGGKIYADAVNFDFYQSNFTDRIEALDPSENYLVYCRSGNRSQQTLNLMEKLGFENVKHLEGGRLAWDAKYNNIE